MRERSSKRPFPKRLAVLIATSLGVTLCLCLIVCLQGPPLSHDHGPAVDPATSCGPVSLGVVARWLGTPRPIDELTRLARAEDSGTSTLIDLQAAAESLGLAARGVRLDPAGPIPWRLPMIVHMKHHFAAALPIDADALVLTDPPKPPVVVRRDELGERWNGAALLVGNSRVELDQTLVQAGVTLPPGR